MCCLEKKMRSIAGPVLDRSALSALDRTQLLQFLTAQSRMRWPRATRGSQVYMDALDPSPHARSQARSSHG
jgi:hypothetical protein